MDGVEENTGAAKDGSGSGHVKEKSGASWERLWSKVPSEVEMGSIGKCAFESTTVLAIDGANMLAGASVVCAGSRKLAGVSISVNMPEVNLILLCSVMFNLACIARTASK